MEHNINWYEGNMMNPLLSNNDDDAQTAYNMDNLKLSELSKRPPPLGLKLTLTPDMLPFTEHKNNAATATSTCQPQFKKVDKLKAVHFPSYMLTIGFFKIEAKYPEDLVAKFYYAKRKLVWEILRDGLKEKIEVQWQNITAIRAVLQENLPGILEIQLEKVPSFFREIEPKPGKHTVWTISHDFTHSQASNVRRHHLQFPPRVLDQYYAKLLQCDNRLLELSQRPFPSSHVTTYFDSYLDQRTIQLNFSHHSKNTHQQLANTNSNSLNSLTSDEAINNYQMLQDPMLTTSWSQSFHYDTLLSMESVARASGIQQNGTELNYEVPSHVNNMLLRGYSIPEIEYDGRHNLVIPSDAQPVETSFVYNNNSYAATQIDWSLLTE